VQSTVLAYDGFRVRVAVPHAGTLEWLGEFLAPWFVAADGDAPARVDLRVAPGALERALADAPPTGETVQCFTLDRPGTPWELRGEAGAWDPDRGALLRKRGNGVEILARDERRAGRFVLVRTLRELAAIDAARRGALPVHASAVAVDGRVTLFAGGKGSGKSTLLLHALDDPDARFVSNDRVHATGTSARGMPTIVTLREGSLAPALRDELASGAWHHASTVAEARAHRAAGTTAPGVETRWPPGLSARQLCALIGREALAGGPIERIVFPSVARGDDAPGRFELRPLAEAEAAARLGDDGLIAGGRLAPFFADDVRIDRDAVASLAARVPCFACRLGPRAYEPPSVWDALRAG
jgi:hypothetical protein